MPFKPKIPCSHKGCAVLIESGTGGKCETHKKQSVKQYNKYSRNKESAKFYDSAAWRKVRKAALYRDGGFCIMCKKVPADVVDHIVPITAGGAKLSLSNLQSLCHKCHNQKTADDEAMVKQSTALKPSENLNLVG